VDQELAHQQWAERETAAGRDPDEQLVPFLDEEPPDPGSAALGSLPDEELVEALLRSRGRVNREYHEQVLVTAEFGRRRERAFAAAAARGVPTGIRPGGFPGEEHADEILSALAPGLRAEQLARKAAATAGFAGRVAGAGARRPDHRPRPLHTRLMARPADDTADTSGPEMTAARPLHPTDLDHTLPWPVGSTSQGNLALRCRTHHRAKQAPDWHVEQTGPGFTRWTMLSGRVRTTTPARYDL
jgi:hypothetical protein